MTSRLIMSIQDILRRILLFPAAFPLPAAQSPLRVPLPLSSPSYPGPRRGKTRRNTSIQDMSGRLFTAKEPRSGPSAAKKNRRIPSVTDLLRRHKKPALQTLFPSDGKDVQTCCVHTRRIMTTRHNTPNTTRHDGNRHNTTTQAARAAIPPHDAVRDPDRNPCMPVMVDRLHAGAAPGPRLLCAPIPPHFAVFPFRSRNAFPSPCPCSEPRNRHASPPAPQRFPAARDPRRCPLPPVSPSRPAATLRRDVPNRPPAGLRHPASRVVPQCIRRT